MGLECWRNMVVLEIYYREEVFYQEALTIIALGFILEKEIMERDGVVEVYKSNIFCFYYIHPHRIAQHLLTSTKLTTNLDNPLHFTNSLFMDPSPIKQDTLTSNTYSSNKNRFKPSLHKFSKRFR